jgi:hypothetical protein
MNQTGRAFGIVGGGIVLAFPFWCACGRDARLAGQKIPTFKGGTVSHYGVTLDQQASPEQVAFVLLRAIREDFEADGHEEREKALAVQYDLPAANELQARNRTRAQRDEFIYKVVQRWTPTVAYYARNFDTDWNQAQNRLIRREGRSAPRSKLGGASCEVLLEVDDPGDDRGRVVLTVWLVQDSGYWRVLHLGFQPARRVSS